MSAKIQKYSFLLFVLIGTLISIPNFATHLKGGEITVKRVSDKTLTFEFTLTTYTENNPANQEQNTVNFCFGDGSGIVKVPRCCNTPVSIGNGTMKNIYKYTYTYPAASLAYKVSVAIPNRNEGVLNITRSVEVPFYVETLFSINSGLGQNSTPLLLNPAVDLTAIVGQPFIHNANAVDAEGDSLAYRLTVSKTGDESVCTGQNRGIMAPGFKQPNDSLSTFTINSKTGDLIWDSPHVVGLYNCAFIVEEWRNGVKISETVRDMQIEVKDSDNRAPKITIPADRCVVAGTRVTGTITAQDSPSKTNRIDALSLSSTGNVYQIDTVYAVKPTYATFTVLANQTVGTAKGNFDWQTNCYHIRKEAYDVFFKVTDNPPAFNNEVDKLVDSKIWKIKVLAPSLKNLVSAVKTSAKSVLISWDAYSCNLLNAEIVLYKKQGNCQEAVNTSCGTGMNLSGFSELARLKSTETQYEDKAIQNNKNYVYVAVVVFSYKNGVEDVSPMSNSSCIFIPSSTPLLTNVSVTKTNATTGELLIRWSRPFKLDTTIFKGPYFYQVQRADGNSNNVFKNVSALLPAQIKPAISDTSFVDIGVNTQNKIYSYKVGFYYTDNGKPVLMENTIPGGNVYLYGQSTSSTAINLAWIVDSPWNNEYQLHRIYREYPRKSGVYNQISEVSVAGANTFTFTDNGKDYFTQDGATDYTFKKDSTYCYIVETVGTYQQLLTNVRLVNASQKVCFTAGGGTNGGNTDPDNPVDPNLAPCAPVLTVDNQDCALMEKVSNCVYDKFTNNLSWKPVSSSTCDPNVTLYRIYYKASPSGKFVKIDSTQNTFYQHIKTDGIRGCYAVSAVNIGKKESPLSNLVCLENCANFELPNLFSPNGDGLNDTWLPMRCPKFVSQVTCKIIDRYGQEVYDYSGSINGFVWDGKNKSGKLMPAATYFYECQVDFDVLDENQKRKVLKGWVELVK